MSISNIDASGLDYNSIDFLDKLWGRFKEIENCGVVAFGMSSFSEHEKKIAELSFKLGAHALYRAQKELLK